MSNEELSWVGSLGERFGIAEDALRLIIGMVLAYPVFLLHNKSRLRRWPAEIQHVYFVLTGMCIAYWTLGARCVGHNLICIAVNYIVLKVFGGSLYSSVVLFLFQLVYLSAGYIANSSTDYVINWTMPHCVLCLRLIAVSMDVYDGTLPEESWSKDQKLNALKEVPSILEMTSQVFFLPSYFTGPQHSMKRFRNFIQRNIDDGDMTGSKRFASKRFMLGWVYLAIHLIFSSIAPVDYVQSEKFQTMPFLKMSFYYTIWVKGILAKYIGAWLLAEGAVILSGLGYNGRKTDGTILWNGGANVRLRLYESCTNFGQLIEAFNTNTNAWCMTYIYKRCRFLNNRMLSQGFTLGFLAIWHGFHSGYYLTFFHELLVVSFEREFFSMIDNSPIMKEMYKYTAFQIATKILGKFYLLFFLPHCFMPFALLKHAIYLPVLWSTSAMVFVFFGTWPLWKIPVKMLLKPVKPKKEADATSNKSELEKKES